MKFMILLKANEQSETGALPPPELFEAMGNYNQQLADAGVLVAGEGLLPSSRGAKVKFADSGATVTDGPFAEARELVAGFWIFECPSLAEAIAWVKRSPLGGGAEVEVRQIAGLEDFGDAVPRAVVEQEQRLRARTGQSA